MEAGFKISPNEHEGPISSLVSCAFAPSAFSQWYNHQFFQSDNTQWCNSIWQIFLFVCTVGITLQDLKYNIQSWLITKENDKIYHEQGDKYRFSLCIELTVQSVSTRVSQNSCAALLSRSSEGSGWSRLAATYLWADTPTRTSVLPSIVDQCKQPNLCCAWVASFSSLAGSVVVIACRHVWPNVCGGHVWPLW